MRRLGLSRRAFPAVLVGVLALGAGGIAIADHSDKGKLAADRVQATEFSAVERERSERRCRGADGELYEELKQRLTGAAVGDPRFAGDIVVHQRVLIRLGAAAGGTTEPIGQAFGTVLYKDPDTGGKKGRKKTGRTKAFVTFLATLEVDPTGSPNPAELPIRAEGAFYGDVFGHPRSSNPLNHGRVISNFTSHVQAQAQRAQGQFGGTDEGGRDDTANTGVLTKGDCGLGFTKAYRKTFGHGHRDHGRGRDDK
ncbi:MAG: hypothetical protein M3N16_00975 [Actinomycetota bacterium]|nr:hypothetical protein [Actinomycetota bacterium]